jgi:integrase
MTTTTTAKRRSPGEGGCYSYQTRDGKTLWRYKCTVSLPDGTRKRLHVRGFKTKTEAQKAMREVITASDKGAFTDPSRQPFGQYLATWLDGLRLRPSTVASYRTYSRLHIVPALGAVPLANITPALLTKLYRDLEKNGRADGQGGLALRTVRYIHTIVSSALRDAVDGGQLTVNPAAKAKPPTVKEAAGPEMHPWSISQVAAFLGWTEKNKSAMYPAWRVLAMTGMRRGELLALRWREVDLDARTITVRRTAGVVRTKGEGGTIDEGPTKTGKPRVIDIDAATVSVLKSHKAQRGTASLVLARDDALVFGDLENRVRAPERFTRLFTETQARARRDLGEDALPAIRLHDLRHGHATALLQAGVPVHIVSQRLGHASPMVTLTVYAHVLPGDQRAAAEAFADLVAGASS